MATPFARTTRALTADDARPAWWAWGLALLLAAHSSQVTLMDWSRGFLQSARRRARALGRPLQTAHESCNRLVHDDGSYDVLTVCQALHWLDDVAVCRGAVEAVHAIERYLEMNV